MSTAQGTQRVRPIPKRYAQAIGYLLDGSATTQKQAAKLANVRPDELCRILKSDKAQQLIQQECSRFLKGIPAIRASATLARLTTARSDDVAAKVSTRIAEHAGIIVPHASPSSAMASAVPLLTIVMRHQAIDGSSVQAAVQVAAAPADNAAIASTSPADHAPTQEGGGPGGHE